MDALFLHLTLSSYSPCHPFQTTPFTAVPFVPIHLSVPEGCILFDSCVPEGYVIDSSLASQLLVYVTPYDSYGLGSVL